MWHELRDALRDAREDRAVRVVLVTGRDGAFSAGQDLGEMTGAEDPGFGAFMDALCEFDKPLLAAVNGVGVGWCAQFDGVSDRYDRGVARKCTLGAHGVGCVMAMRFAPVARAPGSH